MKKNILFTSMYTNNKKPDTMDKLSDVEIAEVQENSLYPMDIRQEAKDIRLNRIKRRNSKK